MHDTVYPPNAVLVCEDCEAITWTSGRKDLLKASRDEDCCDNADTMTLRNGNQIPSIKTGSTLSCLAATRVDFVGPDVKVVTILFMVQLTTTAAADNALVCNHLAIFRSKHVSA
jgi:hypothetical protein